MIVADSGPDRLAVYGTLQPDGANHHVVAHLAGTWSRGTVRGHLFHVERGAYQGYPGVRLADDGVPVRVWVLDSPDLKDHWARLDAFEGPGYRRVTAMVELEEGSTIAVQIYEALVR